MKLKAQSYPERISEICAAAGRPELAEQFIEQCLGEQAVLTALRSGKLDRLAKPTGAAAPAASRGWDKAVAEINARIG